MRSMFVHHSVILHYRYGVQLDNQSVCVGDSRVCDSHTAVCGWWQHCRINRRTAAPSPEQSNCAADLRMSEVNQCFY